MYCVWGQHENIENINLYTDLFAEFLMLYNHIIMNFENSMSLNVSHKV